MPKCALSCHPEGKEPLSTKTNIASKIITSAGGAVVGESVKLVCPPGAVDNPVNVDITLEDPSRYCGLIAQKDLENDVMFCAPVIILQPNGHSFKKPVTLTTKFKIKNFKFEDVVILHGTEARDGRITWRDISHNSKIDEANSEVNITTERFSFIWALLRFTVVRTKDIVSRLNLLAFNYTMSVLFNDHHNELALLFVSQDIYDEQFYKEHETSALVQLKAEGFRELHVDVQEEKRIYNNENLNISIRLGEDYKLASSQQESLSFFVESHVWWSTGHIIKLPLERTKDVRILCGHIGIQGQYGHTSEKHFCELGEFNNYGIIHIVFMMTMTMTTMLIRQCLGKTH